jgi:hypothetical protein
MIFKSIQERDLDLYGQLNQDSSNGKVPTQRSGDPRLEFFLLKSKTVNSQGTNYKFVFSYQIMTDHVTEKNALYSIAFKREV